MASLFGKWFGAQPALSPQLTEALAELAKLTQPSLATASEVLRVILLEIFVGPIVGPASRAGPEESSRASTDIHQANLGDRSRSARGTYQEKLAAGVPLLRGETVTLETDSLRRRWLGICRAVQRQNDDAQALADSFPTLDPGALLTEVLNGRPEAVLAKAETLQLDPALTATVWRFSVFPVLAHLAAALAPVRAQSPWDHGTCPTCGSWPLLGEFRGLDQRRFLRCGLCATDWEFPRLRCPFCDSHDHRQLGFFHIEGQENRYRGATCEECHGYVKMISTLAPLSEPSLLVADLATLHLDLAAAERGYAVV